MTKPAEGWAFSPDSKALDACGAVMLLLSVLCSVGMWTYFSRVLIPYQVSDAAAHGRPRGDISDLYHQWVGARELYLNGRDPYGADVTREIQQGFFGPAFDPSAPGAPRNQRFAYPVYVTFFLAPVIHLPFAVVRKLFFWGLLVLTAATVPLWVKILRWPLGPLPLITLTICTLGNLVVVQGLNLQQMTLLVAALVAIGIAFLVTGRLAVGGVFLALATIKPQLMWLLMLWLMIWAAVDWRRRYRLPLSFLATLALLAAASEWYLPHWIPRFVEALREYPSYADMSSIPDTLVPAPLGWMARAFLIAGALWIGWKNLRLAEDTDGFATTIAMLLVVTVVVIPNYALYNQAMLLPALFLLLRDRKILWRRSRASRALLSVAGILLAWPWLSACVLALLSFMVPAGTVERGWAIPFWTVLPLPVAVAALLFLLAIRGSFTVQSQAATS
jgi:hypothetical protein